MTIDDLLDGPPAVSLTVANSALGIGRTMGYDLARRGKYPIKVFRVGLGLRVATVELCALLGFVYPRTAPPVKQSRGRSRAA